MSRFKSAATFAITGTSTVASLTLLLSTPTATTDSLCQPQPPTEKLVPHTPEPSHSVLLSSFKRSLERSGADLSAADIKDSNIHPSRYGVFANNETQRRTCPGMWTRFRWLSGFGPGTAVLASFPIHSAITANTIVSKMDGGSSGGGGSSSTEQQREAKLLHSLLSEDVIDERTAIILYLLVEKLKKRKSELCHWMCLLPSTFETPLYWSESDLLWIKGTTLYKATHVRKTSLQRQWQQLQPIAKQLALESGVDGAPSYNDFLWAYSVFWSRALEIPTTTTSSTTTNTTIPTEDAIIPGLDFANHNPHSICYWRVTTNTTNTSTSNTSTTKGNTTTPITKSTTNNRRIELVCPRNARLKTGQELTFNYGNKPSEELLFHYGFVLTDNIDDVLMVVCPIPPPSEWEEHMVARMQLLQRKGLRPQLFLPLTALHVFSVASSSNGSGSNNNSRKGGVYNAVDRLTTDELPEHVVETLRVFVMEHRDLEREIRDGSGNNSNGDDGGDGVVKKKKKQKGKPTLNEQVEASGLRMAILTTIVRLLELQIHHLESPEEGTGPLENDQALLVEENKNKLTRVQRNAVVYRVGQKRLTRAWLRHCSELLQEEIKVLSDLQAQLEG